MPGKIAGALMIFVGVALLLWPQADVPRWTDRLIFWGGPALMIVAGVVALERAGVRLATPTTLLLGNASFSIYLFHTFGVSVVARLLGARLGFWPETAMSVLVGLGAGLAAYLFVEKPLMSFLKRVIKRRQLRTLGAASA